jgi:uncharacterized protein (TIGR02145 family)
LIAPFLSPEEFRMRRPTPLLFLLLFALDIFAQEAKKPMVAVLPFTSRVLDTSAIEGLVSAMGSELINTGAFRVMERSQMEGILKEQGFQQSGACDGQECAVEVGKLLSVDQMVLGSIAKVGSTYTLTARLVSVQTGEVLKSVTRNSKADVDAILTDILPQVAGVLSGLGSNASIVAIPENTAASAKPSPSVISRTTTRASADTSGISWNARIGFQFLTDGRDGQEYRVVRIGSQVWMAQNMNYGSKNTQCYNNGPSNCETYGRLYDYASAKTACPSGWHLPTDKDWSTLSAEIGGLAIAGTKLKSAGGWSLAGGGQDSYGFRILPGGGLGNGDFKHLGRHAFFWSNTLAGEDKSWYWNFSREASAYHGTESLENAFSVRCIQD